MKSLAISVKKRENVGKANSKALRNQGKVPCVLYGGEKQVCFYTHENDVRKLVYSPDIFLVNLDIDGTKTSCIMQDIQFHPVTDKILHIDFLEVFEDKEVTVNIPVVLKGIALGVRNGGNLFFRRNKIITRAIPSNLPDSIEIDISELTIGDFIYIKDLKSDKYMFLAPDNSVVVGVKTARAAIEELVVDEETEEGTTEEGDATEESSEEKPTEDTSKEDKEKN
ncbi:MAG: 50S ribosomal protein L25/general stress protein Ctc [Flavobacteriales bacterium]|jgi:large subunit ribosomal protein L25|nr:50S ribosomal protein L25/general stress protein Ctc [Flavobacteriales bacterium]